MTNKYKGGCQCGAVRFEITGALGHASICHCRMCQKAFGNYFAPLVSVPNEGLNWVGKSPTRFASSNLVNRGFCRECGTPLTYETESLIALSIAAFDKPMAIEPSIQYGIEGRIDYLDNIEKWTKNRTEDIEDAVLFLSRMQSNQWPDEN